ncbi:MAG TPA: hypothetical protein VNZ53_38255 [Steroidobacteraceae bacterium]|jgi:hypothetical protein|nr:hypothetical protein [Steroidobacteraceae bacterium]
MARFEKQKTIPLAGVRRSGGVPQERPELFDSAIIGDDPQAAIDFITNILESSTEYSVIAKDLNGKILLWNEGAPSPAKWSAK